MERRGKDTGVTAFMEREKGRHGKSRKRDLHRLQVYRRKLLASATILLLCMSVGGFMRMNVLADENVSPALKPYYVSIRVEEGDSLWSIASRYAPKSPMDIREYIHTLKQINQLRDDTIHTGHYLMVVYYR